MLPPSISGDPGFHDERRRARAEGRPRRSEETAHELRLLSSLSEAVSDMHASLSLADVLGVLADRARAIVGAEVASATQMIAGEDAQPTTATAASPEGGGSRRSTPPLEVPGPWTDVLATNTARRVTRSDIEDEPRWAAALRLPAEQLPARGWLGAPLVGPDGRNLGIVQLVDRQSGEFTEVDEAIVVQLARMASVAVENARLYRAAVEARARLGWAAHVERIRVAELRAIIEAIGEPVLVFDSRERTSLTNPAADRLFGERPVRDFADLVSRFDPAPDPDRPAPIETRLRGDPELWLELRLYAVTGGAGRAAEEPARRIAILRDVTAARRERAHREAFLGILSHELRTPLTTVYAGSKVLARDEKVPAQKRRELAADIASEAERLFRLVEDLLVMTRVERGALELVSEPVLLQRVVDVAIRLEQSHWPNVRLVSRAPSDLPAVSADALSVEQVVRNLLSNAAKYGPAGGTVETILERADDGVVVRVLDHGEGFAEHEADDLFELFYRSPATAAQAAGAGIGLFVCRRLITAMGGRIWARPRPGGGSEFGFWLRRYGEAA